MPYLEQMRRLDNGGSAEKYRQARKNKGSS